MHRTPQKLLLIALGLAATDAVRRSTGLVCDLRWPNDLMLGGKKTGGILVQLADGAAIAGIGINVNQAFSYISLAIAYHFDDEAAAFVPASKGTT